MIEANLLARISRLERIARRDRAFALGALALFLATAQAPGQPRDPGPPAGATAVTAPSGASARVAADGMIVRDAAGMARVAAWIDNGAPSFDESDVTGKLRQSAFLATGLPTFRQYDARGKQRNSLYITEKTQNPGYTITDESNVQRLSAYRGTEGHPEIALSGSDGAVRTYLETDDNVAFLVMRDGGAHTRISMGAYSTGLIGMDVRNPAGTTLWKAP